MRATSCPARHGGGLVTNTPKSGKSREVALPPSVVGALTGHRASQDVARVLAGGEWQEGDFVFTNCLGGPVDPKQDYEAWQALLASSGIRPTRLHNARHSAGTLMGGLGVHLRDIQETFGHSTSKVTERYVHVQSDGLRRAAALMDAALAKEAPETVVSKATETTTETSRCLITLGSGAGLEIPSENE